MTDLSHRLARLLGRPRRSPVASRIVTDVHPVEVTYEVLEPGEPRRAAARPLVAARPVPGRGLRRPAVPRGRADPHPRGIRLPARRAALPAGRRGPRRVVTPPPPDGSGARVLAPPRPPRPAAPVRAGGRHLRELAVPGVRGEHRAGPGDRRREAGHVAAGDDAGADEMIAMPVQARTGRASFLHPTAADRAS